MIQVNAKGKPCPQPVIDTMNAIKGVKSKENIEVLVDNEAAMTNILKYTTNSGIKAVGKKINDSEYKVSVEVEPDNVCTCELDNDIKSIHSSKNIVVAIGSDKMGCGDEKLGKNLLKAFIYSLTQSEQKPTHILFYNSGAYVTCEGSLSIEDLLLLQQRGVKILSCGTCLDYYNLKEKLKVGEITNMYDILSTMSLASLIIKP